MGTIIISYNRVSSAAQSLELQFSLAKHYLEANNIDGIPVEFISDHDVSATKLAMNDRPGLNKLIKLIKTNKVKKIIAYKRDRLARNFYEYAELVKLFLQYDVDVIFTASNEAPFLKNLVFESFYGMLTQMEGMNIKGRTDDARKQYPSNIFGYIRSKENNPASYSLHPEKAIQVKEVFNKATTLNSSEEFTSFMIDANYFTFDRKLKMLTNAFYAGYFQKVTYFKGSLMSRH